MSIHKFLNYVRYRLEDEIIKDCPVDKGSLRQSINIVFEDGNLVIKMLDYGMLVEFGTEQMIAAHGEHDPDNPVTSWAALKKRGGSGQTMPFIRNNLYHKLPQILGEAVDRFLPGADVGLSFE